MGGGFYGGIKNSLGAITFKTSSLTKNKTNLSGTISYNASKAKDLFPFKDGLFGISNRIKGRKPREIIVKNPITSAALFFNTLSADGKKEVFETRHGKGIHAILKDGSEIYYRPVTSSKGSPAVEITVSGSLKIKSHKYHIVKED